jgi:hypothetical protein
VQALGNTGYDIETLNTDLARFAYLLDERFQAL